MVGMDFVYIASVVEQHQKWFKNYNHIELEIPRKFKRKLNKGTDEMVEVPRNILRIYAGFENLNVKTFTEFHIES